MGELNGSIAPHDLLVVIQFLGDQRGTGRLYLGRGRQVAELDFADGRLVGATCGEMSGLEAMSALLLAFRNGQLSFSYVDDWPRAPCPKLGFVDAPSGCYSRPTVLHRCYAAGRPQPITSAQQSQFCLSARFRACPRFGITQGGHA